MNQLFRKLASVLGSFLLTLLVACPPTTVPTTGDTIPPTILGTSAKSNTTVVVIFSEAIVGGNVASNFSISSLNISAASVATDGKTVTLTTSSQTPLQTYTLTISTNITDLAGNVHDSKFDLPIAIIFIGKPIDTTPPTVVSTTATTNTSVTVVFSEAIVGGNVAANFSFPLQLLSSTAASVASDNKTVTITTSIQTANEPYSILVSSSVTDVAGNAYDLGLQNTTVTSFSGHN
jgi:Bacterial Ig-like domain